MGEQAVSIASKHGLNHTTLQRAVRGDLDWIVMKAIEKDRERRYGSAQSMSDDIKRWLSDEPIEARPPSLIYRTSKLLRKHRIKVAIASTIVFGVLISAIGLGFGLSERNASFERQKDAAMRTERLQKLADLEADRNESLRYGNAMIAANESIRNGRRATTLDLLGECPANKRGIEWQWLSYLAADRSIALMPASKDHAQSAVAFALDDKKLYSWGADGVLREWHVVSKKETWSWLAAEEAITAVSVASKNTASQNTAGLNTLVLCGTNSGTVSLWDAETSKRRNEVNVGKPVTCSALFIKLSSGGTSQDRFAVGCDNGSVFVWTDTVIGSPIPFASSSNPLGGAIQTMEIKYRVCWSLGTDIEL
jgi:hypothetical protein